MLMSSTPSSIKELWLTPAATAWNSERTSIHEDRGTLERGGRAYRENGVHRTLTLPMQVDCLQLTQKDEEQSSIYGNREGLRWATPNTMDCLPLRSEEALKKQARGARKGRRHPANLREQVDPTSVQIYNWPTPMAGTKDHMGSSVDYYKRREEKGKQIDLQGQILLQKWTTPIARDCFEIEMNFQIPTRKDGKHRLDTMSRQIHHQEGYRGKLNPRWVETLMGIPVGWTMPSCMNPVTIAQTNSECWEMGLCPTPPQQPSSPCGETWATPQTRDYKGTQGRTNREGVLETCLLRPKVHGLLGLHLVLEIGKVLSRQVTKIEVTEPLLPDQVKDLFEIYPEVIPESILLPTKYNKCVMDIKSGVVIYSQDCVLEVLAERFLQKVLSGEISQTESTPEESAKQHAIEWFDSNIDGAYMGEYSPVYVSKEEEQ